ncbi:RHS repeat-associated core domain-containing protein [Arthrobacter methylotrophus]|uniref:RHS repeat-associated core domain-containing protein n=1 Tax=Arthrobacter methylotrophus TaxID=121291 RepID=A0ABV5UPD2_9MICC
MKFGARYYNPFRGRFTQPDPSGHENNRYAYVGCNPVNGVDPSGLASLCTWAVVAGILGLGAAAVGVFAATLGSATVVIGAATLTAGDFGIIASIIGLGGALEAWVAVNVC